MKHVTGEIEAAGEAHVKVPSKRALAKQQTRQKVLQAARKLFSEQGYEGATIRDIASAAGMSTGAVFANFSDKSDLFREILFSDINELADLMREAASRARTVEESLLRVFMAGYAFYKGQMPLARAAFSISWTTEEARELRNIGPVQQLTEIVTELLAQGVERGELSRESEIKLRSQMLFEAYLANYPNAIFGGWSLEALQARTRDQIRIILAGARRG